MSNSVSLLYPVCLTFCSSSVFVFSVYPVPQAKCILVLYSLHFLILRPNPTISPASSITKIYPQTIHFCQFCHGSSIATFTHYEDLTVTASSQVFFMLIMTLPAYFSHSSRSHLLKCISEHIRPLLKIFQTSSYTH